MKTKREGWVSNFKKAVPFLSIVPPRPDDAPTGDILSVMMRFINFSLMFIGVLAVIIFIYSGFMYLTASGDESKISKAKSTMTYAVVGVIVAVMGFSVVKTIDMIIK